MIIGSLNLFYCCRYYFSLAIYFLVVFFIKWLYKGFLNFSFFIYILFHPTNICAEIMLLTGMSPQSHCGDEEDGPIWLFLWLHYFTMHIYIWKQFYIYIYIYVCLCGIQLFTTDGFFEVAIESWLESGIWTHDHWIPFRRSNRLSYQAMSSTRTQNQLSTATPISSFVQCPISFRLFAFVSRHVYLIEVFCRLSNIFIYICICIYIYIYYIYIILYYIYYI